MVINCLSVVYGISYDFWRETMVVEFCHWISLLQALFHKQQEVLDIALN